jgi:putative DNA primase/helicase
MKPTDNPQQQSISLSSKASLVILSRNETPDGIVLNLSLRVEGKEILKERVKLWLSQSRRGFAVHSLSVLKKSLPDQAEIVSSKITAYLEKTEQQKPKKPGLHTIKASQVKKGKTEWIWNKWIAKRGITNVTGDPGVGKGLLLAEATAKLTTGGLLPGMTDPVKPINVMILAVEDDHGTLRNRLEAAGANLDRVHIYSEYVTKEGKETQFDVSKIEDLETEVQRIQGELIIIDPVLDFLGSTDVNKQDKVKEAMLPLHRLTQRLNIAVVCIIHCNKNDVKALYKGAGSIQFAGKARSVIFVEKSPEDENDVVMCHVKVNRGSKATSETFTIKEKDNNPDLPFIQWKLGETGKWKSDDLLGGNTGSSTGSPKGNKLEVAKTLLIGRLSVGPAPTEEVGQLAQKMGVTEITMKRARKELGVVTLKPDKPGPGAEYRIALPGHEKESPRTGDLTHHVVVQLAATVDKVLERLTNLEKRFEPPLPDEPPLDHAHA